MKNDSLTSCRGFTLVELLVALAISGLLMTAIFAAFQSQQRSYLAQDQVAEVQQNIRFGLDFMVREIRMAGCDPTRTGLPGIKEATPARFGFDQDLNADGDTAGTDESVVYGFKDEFDSEPDGIVDDLNGDGIDNDVAPLGRDAGDGFEAVVENIQAIEFRYLDKEGNETSDLGLIRSVQISLLARAAHPDSQYTNSDTYTTSSGKVWGPYNDNFRRRFQTITVNLRNLDL